LPIATTEEQLALQASIREWAKRTETVELVRGLEPGASAGTGSQSAEADETWAGLADLGVFAIAIPVALGGAGGSTTDLAAALAQLTESLVPGPVLSTLIAGLVLTNHQEQQAARSAVPAIAVGELSVAIALAADGVTATQQQDGSVLLNGQIGPLLGGQGCSHVLVGAAADFDATGDQEIWCLLPATRTGITLTALAPADFSRPQSDLSLTEVSASPAEMLTGVGTDEVRDLAAVLFATEAAAVANWCTRTAAEYAAVRHQFGRPIGSFQAIKHLCASMLCRAETAAVLAWDAAQAVGEASCAGEPTEPGELSLVAAAAAAFNLDAAVDAAKDCIQVLGGIGFTWEHDAHLYLRRALALRQLLGGSAYWRDRAARLAAAGVRRQLRLEDQVVPDNTAVPDNTVAPDSTGVRTELAAARAAARELAASIANLPAERQRAALAEAGYVSPSWPRPYGLGASPGERLVIDDELNQAGVTRPDLVIGGWAIPAILSHGTKAQADRFAGPTLRGEISWCQLFSEPDAGSDLASLRTRAERTDGGWLLTGQKVWTSLAHKAGWAICLARTDLAAPKHKGLTYFLVDMRSHGIDIRPLREITGRQMFNQVFLDQVFVPDDCVVGAPGDGWRAARTTLASERVAMGTGSSVGEAVEHVLQLAARTGAAGSRFDSDPVVRQRLGALIAEGMAVSLLDLQAAQAQLRGDDSAPLAAVRKLVGTGHRQAAAETALELAEINDPEAVEQFLLTRCLSIAGGTTQILLSVVAERLLGLPREEVR
jgi:3-oxochol-4-en-24-oyl-CoA dehydrogenase